MYVLSATPSRRVCFVPAGMYAVSQVGARRVKKRLQRVHIVFPHGFTRGDTHFHVTAPSPTDPHPTPPTPAESLLRAQLDVLRAVQYECGEGTHDAHVSPTHRHTQAKPTVTLSGWDLGTECMEALQGLPHWPCRIRLVDCTLPLEPGEYRELAERVNEKRVGAGLPKLKLSALAREE